MLSDKTRLKALPWLSAGFCAALSVVTLVCQITPIFINGNDPGSGWSMVYICFMPMCFFFVGSGLWQMQREIGEVRKQIADLQGRHTA